MTMLEVVKQLRLKGHKVSFYVRKDGGILIKEIDGIRFTKGASGNIEARKLAGATLSEARSSQLKYATRARKLRKPTLDDEVLKEFNRVKKKWNKAFKSVGGKPHPAGYFGWARIKYAIEKYGKEEALRRIHEAERYSSGIAYTENVRQLAYYIHDASTQFDSYELEQLGNDVLNNAYSIREEWIKPAYDELYKLNAGVPPKEVARNTRRILRL